jgi:hypothetical protein
MKSVEKVFSRNQETPLKIIGRGIPAEVMRCFHFWETSFPASTHFWKI